MNRSRMIMTVYFEDPFWIGVFEHYLDDLYGVAKITFGEEPKNHEILALIHKEFHKIRFDYSHESENHLPIKISNPKRMQRSISRQLQQKGASTKSQIALQMQKLAGKEKRKQKNRLEKIEEANRKFELRKQKKKEKHKGK